MKRHSIPTDTNRKGLTPLELAIHYGHNECATFLVKSMEPVRYSNISKSINVATCVHNTNSKFKTVIHRLIGILPCLKLGKILKHIYREKYNH